MRKKFLSNAVLLVIGSSLLAFVASLIYFIVSLNVDDGDTILLVLIYLKDILNSVSMFIGYATIAYAFFKFGFYEAIMSFLIFIASIIPHLILQISTWNKFAEIEYGILLEGEQALTSFFLGMYNSIGETVVNQILPAVLITFIACKIIRENKDFPTKAISWKNRSQRAMIVFCSIMAVLNIAFAFVTQYLPILIETDFVLLPNEFELLIKNLAFTIVESLIIHLPIAYTVFMITYKLHECLLNTNAAESKQTVKSKK